MNDEHSDLGLAGVTRLREREISRVFVQLADTLVDDFDVVELLDRRSAGQSSVRGVFEWAKSTTRNLSVADG